MKPITPFGKKWEWSRSIWLVWLLFPFGFFSFISFTYIGLRARQMKWVLAALIYFLIVVQFFVVTEMYPHEHVVYDIAVGLALIGWIVAWIQAFLARVEYLQILVKSVTPAKMTRESYLAESSLETKATVNGPPRSQQSLKLKKPKRTKTKTPAIININKATEQELKQLPSIGTFLAQEIITTRKRMGSFVSYAHLVACLKIKPHVLAKAKQYIVYSDDELKKHRKVQKTNKDKTKQTESEHTSEKRTGRVVDY